MFCELLRNKTNRGRGDAYDCAEQNVLVNIEPDSPHRESDGVHKDNVIITTALAKSNTN
jgi:hypothetical protein